MSKLTKQHLEYLHECLQAIDFGSVVITVHNGQITQIDATEKKRFESCTSNTRSNSRRLVQK